MINTINETYKRIEAYAKMNGLYSVLNALPYVREALTTNARNESVQNRYKSDFLHGLQVSEMLLDLELYKKFNREEEDALVAAVIMHVYFENFSEGNMERKIIDELGLAPMVWEIAERIMQDSDMSEEELHEFYERAQTNKYALLAVLADRGNILQGLHRFSSWNAHRYIDETKACYYPMGIYGKEHYHELLAPISTLMEKMRTLIEVSEVLLRRYEDREADLLQDILALREENATIKGIIAKFKNERI